MSFTGWLTKKHVQVLIGGGSALLLVLGFTTLVRQTAAQSGITMAVTPNSASTLTIGSAYGWTCKATNNSGAALSYGLNFYIIAPNGNKIQVFPPVPLRSVRPVIGSPGVTSSRSIASRSVTTSMSGW